MKFATYTLGCKVNQYETQALEAELTKRGYTQTSFSSGADIYIINTCTVTSLADKKSRQAIRKAKKLSPDAVIAVCGCGAQLNHEELSELGIDLLGGSAQRMDFLAQLETMLSSKQIKSAALTFDNPLMRRDFEILPLSLQKENNPSAKTRAFLKIQDGCSNFCAYCIIPFARGPARSMSLRDAVEHVTKLKNSGYRETVITGIEISSYRDNCESLTSLLPELLHASGEMRLRLGSLEPRIITPELLDSVRGFNNLCPHFHLSLQSGSDKTLSRMERKYSTAEFFSACELLRKYFPGCAITADLITGFPGETETEFAETLKFIEHCEFASMHIFPYSRRKNTKAYSFPNQLPGDIKKTRAALAQEKARLMEYKYNKAQLNRTLSVLFETEKDGFSSGHSENYCKVIVNGTDLRGKIRDVLITDISKTSLIGKIM